MARFLTFVSSLILLVISITTANSQNLILILVLKSGMALWAPPQVH